MSMVAYSTTNRQFNTSGVFCKYSTDLGVCVTDAVRYDSTNKVLVRVYAEYGANVTCTGYTFVYFSSASYQLYVSTRSSTKCVAIE